MWGVRVHPERGRGDVIPNPMKPKNEGCYHLITSDKDDSIQTHLILIVSTCKYKLSEEEFVKPIVEIVRECGFSYEIKRYRERIDTDYSKVIVCGTALMDLDYLRYVDKFEWLKDYDGEVLGICAGYQIIAKVFDNDLVECKKIGVYEFEVVKDNPLIGKGTWKAYFLHRYALKDVKNLECLAMQKDEVCMFKVVGREFYGVSFHPEVLNREIVVNFLHIS